MIFKLKVPVSAILLIFMSSMPLWAMQPEEKTRTTPIKRCSSNEEIQFWQKKRKELLEKKEASSHLLKSQINSFPSCFLELDDLFRDKQLVKEIQKTIQKYDDKNSITLVSQPAKLVMDQFRIYDLLNHLHEIKHVREEGVLLYNVLDKKLVETIVLTIVLNNITNEKKSDSIDKSKMPLFLPEEETQQLLTNLPVSKPKGCEFFDYTDISFLNNDDGYYFFTFIFLNLTSHLTTRTDSKMLDQQLSRIFSYRNFNQTPYNSQVVPTRLSITLMEQKKKTLELEIKQYAKDPVVYPFYLTSISSDAIDNLHYLLHYVRISDYTKMASDPDALLLFKHIRKNTMLHFLSSNFKDYSPANRLLFIARVMDVEEDTTFSEPTALSPGLINARRDRRSSSSPGDSNLIKLPPRRSSYGRFSSSAPEESSNLTKLATLPKRRSSERYSSSPEENSSLIKLPLRRSSSGRSLSHEVNSSDHPQIESSSPPKRSLLQMQAMRRQKKAAMQQIDQDQNQDQKLHRPRAQSENTNPNKVNPRAQRDLSPPRLDDLKGNVERPRAKTLGCEKIGRFTTIYEDIENRGKISPEHEL